MINLKMVRQTLEALDKKEVTQEDILGVYVDLNEAVRLSGSSLSSLPVEDPLRLAEYLAACGTDFLRTTRINSELLSGEDPMGKIARKGEKIEQRLESLEQQIKELNIQKAETERKSEELERKEKDAKLVTEKLNAEIESLGQKERQIVQLEASNRNLEREIKRLKTLSVEDAARHNSDLQQKLEEAKSELSAVQHGCDELSNQISKLEDAIFSAQQEQTRRQTRADKLSNDNNRLQEALDGLERTISAQKDEFARLDSKYESVLEESARLADKKKLIEDTKTNANKIEEENRKLSEQLDEQEKELSDRDAQLKAKRAEIESRSRLLDAKQKAANEEKSRLEEKHRELSNQNVDISIIEDKCKELGEAIKQLSTLKLPDAQSKYAAAKSRKEDLEKEIKRLEQESVDLKQEIERLTTVKQQRDNSGYAKKSAISQLKHEISDLNGSYEADADVINRLKGEKADIEYQCKKLNDEKITLRDELEKMRKQYETERARYVSDDVPEHNKKIESIKRKMRMINELKNNLKEEIESGVVTNDQETEQLTSKLEREMEGFENKAKEIEKIYGSITQILDE